MHKTFFDPRYILFNFLYYQAFAIAVINGNVRRKKLISFKKKYILQGYKNYIWY